MASPNNKLKGFNGLITQCIIMEGSLSIIALAKMEYF